MKKQTTMKKLSVMLGAISALWLLGCGGEDTPEVGATGGADVSAPADTASGESDAVASTDNDGGVTAPADSGGTQTGPGDDAAVTPPGDTQGGQPDTTAPPFDAGGVTQGCVAPDDAQTIADGQILTALFGCTGNCLGQPPECGAQCVSTETGLSSVCAGCVAAVGDCALQACANDCLGGVTPACEVCIVGACGDGFAACAGVSLPEPTPCTPACDGVECGADGCGGTCGACETGFCNAGTCEAVASACDNPDDAAAIDSTDPAAAAQDCGFQCIADPDLAGCAVACIADTAGLTPGCAFCFGQQLGCTANACLAQCFDPAADACKACQAQNCDAAFQECAGVTYPGAFAPPACMDDPNSATLEALDTQLVLQDCAAGCAGDDQIQDCAAACVGGNSLSPTCEGCFADVVLCMDATCAAACADPTTGACASCVATQCAGPFELCAGIALAPLFPCEASCDGMTCGGDGCGGVCGTCDADFLCVDGGCAAVDSLWCDNGPDMAALEGAGVLTVSAGCAPSCFGNPTQTECIGTCMSDGIGLSDPCGYCFGLEASCTIESCFNDCLADSAAPACLTCRETSCGPAFESCAGLAYTDWFVAP